MEDSIIEQIDMEKMSTAKIKVIGVGGGGGNAIRKMIESNLTGVQFIAANTDLQALNQNKAPIKIQLGAKLTRGLGAGSDPKVGKEAAVESADLIKEQIGDADMVFITAGMGGGTGTGAAPVIAQIAKELGALTVGVVTKPFRYEGPAKKTQAENGIEELSAIVDNLIIIPNDRLRAIAPKNSRLVELFNYADTVLYEGVRSISDVIMRTGLMNVDFADVRAIMREKGRALMGTGVASGETRAKEATEKAIKSPLLDDVSLETAKAILCNITCTEDFVAEELDEIGYILEEATTNSPMIKLGVVFDETMGDNLQVTVIATGIEPIEVQDLEEETVGQPGSNTLRFPNPLEKQPAPQPQISFQQPVEEPAYGRTRRNSRDPYYDQKLARVSYGQARDYGPGQSRYVPGKETYVHVQEDLEIPTFLRNNAD